MKYTCLALFFSRFSVVLRLLKNVICLSVVCYDNASNMQ